MSEAKKEEGSKKKGMLPVIVGLVLVLGGGGFFMMKKDAPKEKEKPKVELGHGDASIVEIEEKLYNLADGNTFLRCTIALHMDKNFDGSHLTKDVLAATDDALFEVMTSKRPKDFFGVANIKALKEEIAAKVNSRLNHESHDDDEDEDHEEKSSKKKKKKKSDEEHLDLDSHTGPVLKVYIRALAIQ
jgi:flagellar basal body-associated protein FliL